MGKGKIQRFAELETFTNVFQPPFEEIFNKDSYLKGSWNKLVFKNDAPIILELGCGKGEYTIGLAERYPDKNFIGIDIKGARMWLGAKYAFENKMPNVRFLRTRIEFIKSFFGSDEIHEIWITFPDPQSKEQRAKKRLTGSPFLNSYRQFLQKDGLVHLKTDSLQLHQYTLQLIKENGLFLLEASDDLYHSEIVNDILSIHTFYENQFLAEGKKVTYLKFRLSGDTPITEPENTETFIF